MYEKNNMDKKTEKWSWDWSFFCRWALWITFKSSLFNLWPSFLFFHFLRGLPINIFAHWQKNPLMREWLYKLCVCTNGILYILQEEWSWTAPHILIHKNTKAISNQIKVAECLWATYMQKSKKNNILFLFLPVNCTTNSWKGTL